MAVWFAWFLALLYAVATPLGRRFGTVALWAGRSTSTEEEDAAVRDLVGRGWHALLSADLWLLPALGAGILLFQHPWQVLPLLVAAFGGAALLHRVPVWPGDVIWYLARLRGQLEGRVRREGGAGEAAVLLARIKALEDRYGGAGIAPPSADEARRSARGDPDGLLRLRRGTGSASASDPDDGAEDDELPSPPGVP